MVEEHGIVFIGPSPEHIRMMGDKITAKKTMIDLGIPVIMGSEGCIENDQDALSFASKIGYPILIKATSGGGGKGMKVCQNNDELLSNVKLARIEAKANFGFEGVYMERYLQRPRHIEVQIIADKFGNVVNLGERDCSLQRRHQKVLEEAPSPALNGDERKALGKIVNDAIAKMGYLGLGTLEFLYEDGQFFFMEMNTRLQVEHTITEMITGIDLVKEQIRVACGQKLSFTQDDIAFKGHAIECRINAEDPKTFLPSPGRVGVYHAPGGYGVRVDSHIYAGCTIPPYYDSMVSKLITYGKTRHDAMQIMKRALQEYVIEGVNTTIDLHKWLLECEDIKKGDYNIHWLEKHLPKD